MSELNDKQIIKAVQAFFKSHYRYRDRYLDKDTQKYSEISFESDLRGEGGIIADGALTFLKEDGTKFLATFEATSLRVKQEVLYKLRTKLLLWDALAFALLSTTVFTVWSHISRYSLLQNGALNRIALLLAVLVNCFLLYFLLCRWLKRYRYIYAVEQFKQYFADEQWIALAHDVFQDLDDPYLVELKRQCVKNGIGLVSVDDLGQVHMSISPSRQDVFKSRRRAISLFSLKDIGKMLPPGVDAGGLKKLGKRAAFILEPFNAMNLKRFKQPHLVQNALVLLSVFIIGVFLVREYKERKRIHISQERYEKLVEEKLANESPEPFVSYVDTLFVLPLRPDMEPYDPYTVFPRTVQEGGNVIIGLPGLSLYYYDCSRLKNFQRAKYIIQEGIYPDFETAADKVFDLTNISLPTNAFWLGCFWKSQSGFLVFLGEFYNTREEAEEALFNFRKLMPFTGEQKMLKIIAIVG